MVIIQLISTKTGEPIKGKRVSVSTSGFLSGGVTDRKATNDRGEVEFSNIKPCDNGKIYLDGNTAYEGKIDGFQRIYV